MKKLFLLVIVCMVSMLAFAQTESATDMLGGGAARQGPSQQLASDNELPPSPADSVGTLGGKQGLSQDSDNELPSSPDSCVTLTPTSYNFGNVAVDFSSSPATFWVLNGCGVDLIVTNVNATGAGYTQTNNCIGMPVSPHGYCTIVVTFKPGSQGVHNQQLIVTDYKQGDPNDPMTQTSSLTGTGVADVTLTPPSCSFGAVQIGDSGECVVTLTNNETVSLTINSIQITPPLGSPFTEYNNCPMSLGKNHTCAITVTFTPTTLRPAFADLIVRTNSLDGTPPEVGLSGSGVPICRPPMCP